jgi:hypothetical protein
MGTLQRVLDASCLQRGEGRARQRLGVTIENERAGSAGGRLDAHHSISNPASAKAPPLSRLFNAGRDPRSLPRGFDQTPPWPMPRAQRGVGKWDVLCAQWGYSLEAAQ